MSDSGIQINGAFGKIIATIVVALLIAGVVGVWNMNSTQAKMITHIEWIIDTQVKMGKRVEENRSRLDRLGSRSEF